MAKFHVNDKGEAGKCGAKKRDCPFGGENEHYDTMHEAQVAAEKQLEQEFGAVSVIAATAPQKLQVSERAHLSEEENEAIDRYREMVRGKMAGKESMFSPKEDAADTLRVQSKRFFKKFHAIEGIPKFAVRTLSFDAGSLTTGYYTLNWDNTPRRFDVGGLPEEPASEYKKAEYRDIVDEDKRKGYFYAYVEEGVITHEMWSSIVQEGLEDAWEHIYAHAYLQVNAPVDDTSAPYDPNAPEEYHLEQAANEISELRENGVLRNVESVEVDVYDIKFKTKRDAVVAHIKQYPHLTRYYLSHREAEGEIVRHLKQEGEGYTEGDTSSPMGELKEIPYEWRKFYTHPLKNFKE